MRKISSIDRLIDVFLRNLQINAINLTINFSLVKKGWLKYINYLFVNIISFFVKSHWFCKKLKI